MEGRGCPTGHIVCLQVTACIIVFIADNCDKLIIMKPGLSEKTLSPADWESATASYQHDR